MAYLSFKRLAKMDIDLTSIIISIVAFSFFLVPIIYDQFSRKKGSGKVEKQFLEIAGNHQLVISQHDVWRNMYAIGIDKNSGKVFYYKMHPGSDKQTLIDLSEVQLCKVSKKGRNIKSPQTQINVTDRIELIVTGRDPKKPDRVLEIFDGKKGDVLSGQLALAEKWAQIINSNLAN